MTAAAIRNCGILARCNNSQCLIDAGFDPVTTAVNRLGFVRPRHINKTTLIIDFRICLAFTCANPKMY